MLEALIGPIMTVAGKLIKHVITMATEGDAEGAKQVVERFVAVTEAELAADKDEALAILRKRFEEG